MTDHDTAPPQWCRHCHYPLGAHDNGICEDGATYAFLPIETLTGTAPTADVSGSWGAGLWLFWLEDCFAPPVYVVRGDSWSDAHDWFADYLIGRGLVEDLTDTLTADEMAALRRGECVDGLEYVDGHDGLYDLQGVNGRAVIEAGR